MKHLFRKKRSNKIDPADLHRKASEAIVKTQEQQPHVFRLSSWLNWRNGENGFGNDFDYTIKAQKLIPKESQ